MKEEVLQFINKHQLIRRKATVLIGTSGGPDSMALLHFLHSIREKWELKLICISVDHGIRGEDSLADLHYVETICEKWEIPFIGTSVDVPSYKREKNISDEVAARELRYRFFKKQMERFQADYLALGHHGDDQVETMLMSLTRSANSRAFSGIPVTRPFGTGMIIRPFLCITKDAILNYCAENDIASRIDPTNFETNYTRNFFRKHVVPLIKEKNKNIHTTIRHLSETLQEDEDFLLKEAEKVVKDAADLNSEKKICTIQINLFTRHPLALQRRAFHLILNYLYDEMPKNLSYIHDEHFFALLKYDKGNAQIDFPFNLKLEKSYGRLHFYFSHQSKATNDSSYFKPLDIPGKIILPDGSTVSATFVDHPYDDDFHVFTCSVEQIALPLHIRNRKPGDRMTWRGLNGSKKLKDLFIDYKVPVKERGRWPIVVDDQGKILWLIGLKKNYPEVQPEKGIFIQLHYDKR